MPQLWERQAWETPAMFRAFHEYYLPQRPPRSVDEAYRTWWQKPERSYEQARKKVATGAWRAWSRGQKSNGVPIPDSIPWTKRAQAFDDHLAALDRQKWEDRRLEVRETDWRQAGRLRQIADEILAEAPKFTRSKRQYIPGKNGEPDREIITVALNGALAVKAVETASKLSRLAAELETERKQIEIVRQELNGLLDILQAQLDPETYQRVLEAIAAEDEIR